MDMKSISGASAFIEAQAADIRKSISIDKSYYKEYDVKRGLRNSDGTGVMAGVTRIGNVRGYYVQDGEKTAQEGRLFYRGYDVADIVSGFLADGRLGFEETAYLLLFGSLPDAPALAEFKAILAEYRELPKGFTEDMILSAPSKNIMNKLARSVLALYSYDEDPEINSEDIGKELAKALHLIAQCPVIAVNAYAAKCHYFDGEDLHLHRPNPEMSIAENILNSLRHDEFTFEEAQLLDLCMVLHAEHGGGNNSAFACRVLTSSGTDIYSSISAAVGSLKGPRHGGANEKVMKMFSLVEQDVFDWKDDDEIKAYLKKVLNREAGLKDGLIYGMGHAIYTLSDPRAVMLKSLAGDLAEKAGMSDRYKLLEAVERLTPEVFTGESGNKKVMCANVDMYSGFVYEMLKIPSEIYTPLFAISRMVGWCAHRMEEAFNSSKIIRPAYKAIIHGERYVPLDKR